MKKVFFAFVAVTAIALTACNNKPAEGDGTTTDTTVVSAPVDATAPADTTVVVVTGDSTAVTK